MSLPSRCPGVPRNLFLYTKDMPRRGLELYCGDFEHFKGDVQKQDPKTIYVIPEEMSGGDYSGSLYNRANYEAFLKSYKNRAGIHSVYGGYGTYEVAIRLDTYQRCEDIQGTLESLTEYPLLCEDTLTDLQMKAEEEAWKSWVERDVVHSLNEVEGLAEWEPDDELQNLFNWCIDEAGEYWEIDGQDVIIRINKIIPYMADHLILKNTSKDDLPLLITRDWVSDQVREEYEALLKGVPVCTTVLS